MYWREIVSLFTRYWPIWVLLIALTAGKLVFALYGRWRLKDGRITEEAREGGPETAGSRAVPGLPAAKPLPPGDVYDDHEDDDDDWP